MSASTAVAWVTSVDTKIASPPCSVILWTVWCPPSSCMSAMMSLAPSLAQVSAVALPIPDAPPVTHATLPSSRPGIGGLLHVQYVSSASQCSAGDHTIDHGGVCAGMTTRERGSLLSSYHDPLSRDTSVP